MRAVIQRVAAATVVVEGVVTGHIEKGLCVLVGVGANDTAADVRWLAQKVVGARIFNDSEDKMNLSVADVGGRILAVSQFTLYGDLRSGKRPSFSDAMEPLGARQLFDLFCTEVRALGIDVQTGIFRAHMDVTLCNSGPVTLLLDSNKTF